ncbi:redoxin family protein [Candidatus Sororendozoicomonas aggregata]|uniref:redoxin family protein n=1 Tax=Candidatus Sororendozoicomonas aggregata TaxID=3073239 RepID=UPI002ED44969
MFTSKEGQPVPEVTFKTRKNDKWVNLNSNDIFSGKSVIIFGLPGAYTPTCSSAHLPRYEELFGAFNQQGIDDIYCLSVNDAFVMNS